MASIGVDYELFGFCGVFGFSCSGFWCELIKTLCSGCSVEIVEKLCKSMWGSRWEKRGKNCGKVTRGEFYTVFGGIFRVISNYSGKIYTSFARVNFPVIWRFCTVST